MSRSISRRCGSPGSGCGEGLLGCDEDGEEGRDDEDEEEEDEGGDVEGEDEEGGAKESGLYGL